jgi:hypothetical protein
MIVSTKRSMVVGSRRKSKYGCVLVLFIAFGSAAVFIGASNVYAAGVHLGFGVDVPFPGPAVAPPVVMYPPPVVVERTPPPPSWVVEQVPPPVVIRRTPPPVVYEGPVVVERRSTVYYYPRSQEYRSQRLETDEYSSQPRQTEREYYRERSRSWENDNTTY